MEKIRFDSPAALQYLNTLHMIVNRMGTNSANCKTWCITLIFATTLLFVNTRESEIILMGVIPLLMFCVFDAYYLGMEKRFRSDYDAIAEKLRTEGIELARLFEINEISNKHRRLIIFRTLGSFSIWPFYGLLSILLIAAYSLLTFELG
jgi:hypothetical protein